MTRATVFICGDLHNLGDLALLLQNLEVARGKGRKLHVRRWRPLPAEIEMQVQAAGGILFDGRSLAAIVGAAREADVVIGGGQLIRQNVSLKSIVALLAIVVIARATGGRVIARGLGISAIKSGVSRLLWRAILALTACVRVRDAVSLSNGTALTASRKLMLTADMAFLDSTLHLRLAEQRSDPATLVIAPCIDASEGRSIEGPAIAAIIAAVRERPGAGSGIAFACHDPQPGMDVNAAHRLVAQLGLGDVVIHDDHRLEALFELYGRASLVVTNRLHAAIFSLLGGRAVLVIDDGTHKIAALAERFAIPSIAATAAPSPAAAARIVAEAIGFDRARRGAVLAELALSAARNLD